MQNNETASRILPTSDVPTSRKRTKRVVATATAPVKRRGTKAAALALSARRKVALVVGAVGCAGLLLSLWHCTEALNLLTGMPVVLACLLAVMFDCGMVICEVAAVVSEQGSAARRCAAVVVLAAALVSTVLNSLASGQHSPAGFEVFAYLIGAVVPLFVFGLFQVASHLWTE